MSGLVRFGVSLEKELLDAFDRLIAERKYTNRSEAFRDMIRRELIEKEWERNVDVAGAITFIYDHHQPDLLSRVVHTQHDFGDIIISSQHIHISHDLCLEIVAVRGSADRVHQLANSLKALRGVQHATLSTTSTGQFIG